MTNPKCYFDITIGGAAAGRIVMEVSFVVVVFPSLTVEPEGRRAASNNS